MNLFEHNPADNLLPFDGDVRYYGQVLAHSDCIDYFDQLLSATSWQHDQILINGKIIHTKRQIAWHADAPIKYHYSGSTKHAQPWTPTLLKLKDIVEEQTNHTFNSCLLNFYQSGEQAMAWHSDNETELGKQPTIASLSLGAIRKFSFKHKLSKHTCSIELEPGGLLVMKGETQRHWLHSLPATTQCHSPRINLTFRVVY